MKKLPAILALCGLSMGIEYFSVNSAICARQPASTCSYTAQLHGVIATLGARVFKTDETGAVIFFDSSHEHAGLPVLRDSYEYYAKDTEYTTPDKYVRCRDEEDTDDGKEEYNLALFWFYREHRTYNCCV